MRCGGHGAHWGVHLVHPWEGANEGFRGGDGRVFPMGSRSAGHGTHERQGCSHEGQFKVIFTAVGQLGILSPLAKFLGHLTLSLTEAAGQRRNGPETFEFLTGWLCVGELVMVLLLIVLLVIRWNLMLVIL